jgi:predicted O-methyltransferase YrrM
MSDTTLAMNHDLQQYLIDHSVHEPEVLKELRVLTQRLSESRMQISPEQGQFMRLLMQLTGATKTLDIGTFTGYSSLVVALALPANGKVVTFDISDEWTSTARQFWQAAGVTNKIDLKIGFAEESLQSLINNGEINTYDFAFIDADKANYDRYYEACMQLVKPGGMIAVDNVLWDGKVADRSISDTSTNAIRALNKKIYNDKRVLASMLPIGDGLTLAIKQ